MISPEGERLVTMTAEDYQDLIDARDAEAAMRAVDAGTLQTLSGADVDAWLAASTPLAFWRKRRGLTQADMARSIGVSQPYLAQLENGRREGSVSNYRRLARQLGLRVHELLPDEPDDEPSEPNPAPHAAELARKHQGSDRTRRHFTCGPVAAASRGAQWPPPLVPE